MMLLILCYDVVAGISDDGVTMTSIEQIKQFLFFLWYIYLDEDKGGHLSFVFFARKWSTGRVILALTHAICTS